MRISSLDNTVTDKELQEFIGIQQPYIANALNKQIAYHLVYGNFEELVDLACNINDVLQKYLSPTERQLLRLTLSRGKQGDIAESFIFSYYHMFDLDKGKYCISVIRIYDKELSERYLANVFFVK